MEFNFREALENVGFTVDLINPTHIKGGLDYDPLTNSFTNTEEGRALSIPEITELLAELGNLSPTRWDHLKSATDLRQVETKWLIEDILPLGQIGVILAPPKSFKSLFTLKLALAIAQGKEFAGHKVTQSNVLFIQNENSESDEAGRMRLMTSDPADNLTFDFSRTVRMERLKEIKPIIEARDIKLVIIDPLYLSFDNGAKVFKDEDLLTDILTEVKEFKLSLGDVSFLLLHHTRKIDGNRKNKKDFEIIADDAYGTTFLNAWREVLFCLTPFDWGSMVSIEGRSFNPDFKLACKINSFGFEVMEVPDGG